MNFSEFNFSTKTLDGLNSFLYIQPTVIQLKALPHCLKDKDVIVQAKTGSGKTLVYLIPILEKLSKDVENYKLGIQALVLLPTAELAIQVADVFQKLCKYHVNITQLTILGNKSKNFQKHEKFSIGAANLLIATPGKLLTQFESNSTINLDNLRYLILDEADQLLDETFIDDIKSLLRYIPNERVNWLFSATQYVSINHLSILNMKDPVIIGTKLEDNENDVKVAFPLNLKQYYMKVNLPNKLQILWNLINRKNSKIVVFFSTQKEVLYFYKLFKTMQTPFELYHLRSNMRLDKRMNAIDRFTVSSKEAVLFATDVVSRGLDIQNVSLIVQYDLPSKLHYYVHRVGRTARYSNEGTSILMIMPIEMEYLNVLKQKGANIKEYNLKMGVKSKNNNLATKANNAMKSVELVQIGTKALNAYIDFYNKRSTIKSNDITVEFNINKLPIKEYATSLGFSSLPIGLKYSSNTGLNRERHNMIVKGYSIIGKSCRINTESNNFSENDEIDYDIYNKMVKKLEDFDKKRKESKEHKKRMRFDKNFDVDEEVISNYSSDTKKRKLH